MYTSHFLFKFLIHKYFYSTVDKKNPTPRMKQHRSYGTFAESGREVKLINKSFMKVL